MTNENHTHEPSDNAKRLAAAIVTERVKEQAIGLAILIVLVVLGYLAGVSEGRKQAENELPQLSAVTLKINRIERAMEDNTACAASMIDAARSQ